MIVNRAGWHDPQARINVLTADSDRYKTNNTGLTDPISPYVSAREEPFFFRAFSGECIEFRHTNELPKDLELDDFQVKTPTDTIGQHIHLVKFDVTASDGSGNGFNYEDGTFAPDEIRARLKAAGRLEGEVDKDVWRLKRGERPELFQTTVQRWFADPILSEIGSREGVVDRTMRTVFTHDHFGPSSIQQHGFYAALIIEPAETGVCPVKVENPGAISDEECRTPKDLETVAEGDEVMTGTRKVVLNPAGC